jgi:murein DD-endopeptidase MepM/ murein hydrolase activator NlpD
VRRHPIFHRSVASIALLLLVGAAGLVRAGPGSASTTLPAADPALRYPMTMPVTGRVESLVGGGCPSARSHSGVDISSPLRTAAEIRAAESGFATAADTGNGYGTAIDIVHDFPGGRYVSRYAHLSRVLVPPGGAWVAQGQVIGMMGSTGDAQIVHLHFEVRDGAGAVIDLNPAFGPCRRDVTAGAPIELDLPGLVPLALVLGQLDAANRAAGLVLDPRSPEAGECRYWDRVDDAASDCGADPDGAARRRAHGPRLGTGA